jgi:hypothetical protein
VRGRASPFGNRAFLGRPLARYRSEMDIVPNDLTSAAASARSRLASLSVEAAHLNTGPGSSRPAMAAAAREAVFADALLAALHARFEELKGVAK